MSEEMHPIQEAEMEADTDMAWKPRALERPPVSANYEDTVIEKPKHRIICYRAAAGDTPAEISEQVGLGIHQVRVIIGSPRSQQMIADLIEAHFSGDVSNLMKGAQVEAITTIVKLCNEATSETVKLNSAKEILDRTMGKAPQKIETSTPKSLLEQAEAARDEEFEADSEKPISESETSPKVEGYLSE